MAARTPSQWSDGGSMPDWTLYQDWSPKPQVMKYPVLTSPPLDNPRLAAESERLGQVGQTIWWQVLVDVREKKDRGNMAQVWTDLEHTLAKELEKRLIEWEADSSAYPPVVEYQWKNYQYNLIVPGCMQYNKTTHKQRRLRRLCVSHHDRNMIMPPLSQGDPSWRCQLSQA
jgi:hypothetical protein